MRTITEGLNKAVKNLQNKIKDIEDISQRALSGAANYILDDADRTFPTIPVHYGNLRRSRFVVQADAKVIRGKAPAFRRNLGSRSDRKILRQLRQQHSKALTIGALSARVSGPVAVSFGFGAYYALEVHEKHGVQFRRQDAGAKFFETAIDRNKDTIIKHMADKIKSRMK